MSFVVPMLLKEALAVFLFRYQGANYFVFPASAAVVGLVLTGPFLREIASFPKIRCGNRNKTDYLPRLSTKLTACPFRAAAKR